MNSLINQSFQTKTTHFARRFTYSVTFAEITCLKHEESSTLFDPPKFFSTHRMSKHKSVRNTKVLHAHLLTTGALRSNIFFTNSLLDWYCKSGAVVVARKLFDAVPLRQVISWNIMMSGYNHNSMFQKSWEIFCGMHLLGFEPNESTYRSVLSACAALQAPIWRASLFPYNKKGFISNGYVRSGMMDMFAKSCSFNNALRIFFDVSCDNKVCWNVIISGAVRNGENWVALDLFRQMCSASLFPNSHTFSSILTACTVLRELEIGKAIHVWLIKCGVADVFVDTAIIDLYAKCGCMHDAAEKFSQMTVHNVGSWTAIISGFVREDDSVSALEFFKDMREVGEEISNFTVTSVLAACAKPGMIEEASQIHSLILKLGFCLDVTVGAALINMYAKLGEVGLSDLAFSEIKNSKDQGKWAAMMSSFAQNKNSGNIVELFQTMLAQSMRPDSHCISSVLSVISCLNLGRQMHCYCLKSGQVTDLSLGSSIFTMYSKCGCLGESYEVFEKLPQKDNVSWTSMIAGFADHGHVDRAFQLLKDMLYQEIAPDQITLIAILTACSARCILPTGKEIHGYVFRLGSGTNTVVVGALVTMYSKCGRLELARKVFNMLPQKDPVACSSLVSGYAQNGLIEEAILAFNDMLLLGVEVDSFIISSILRAVALLNKSSIGIQLHAFIVKLGLASDASIGSSLVTMYSNYGSIEDCRKVFDQVEKPDLISWTAIIVSYAQHGKGAEALATYELMRKEGIQPDSVTFVGVLLACSHSGLVEVAFFYFNLMVKDYGIKPGHRHYACIVDILGRSGRLREAESFINNMPLEPDALIWGTLLAACQVHGDFELGKMAAKKVMELGSCDAGAYVSLSNICADVGQWEEVANIRSLMKGTGTKKEPGWSYV
ncbi:hypothetical protein L6164_011167 [Bauhinia variegata]|uniref:Uncharacterized protein n=1 Tax=Bauhinia variegata TaxID=167791 RepID=A0ACB9P7M6_BAUVA|nr:hypothetical protein L6164_011167 [Bauhinia variegata]